jgi:hypothetical protein
MSRLPQHGTGPLLTSDLFGICLQSQLDLTTGHLPQG